MRCDKCGQENLFLSTFCGQCGVYLKREGWTQFAQNEYRDRMVPRINYEIKEMNADSGIQDEVLILGKANGTPLPVKAFKNDGFNALFIENMEIFTNRFPSPSSTVFVRPFLYTFVDDGIYRAHLMDILFERGVGDSMFKKEIDIETLNISKEEVGTLRFPLGVDNERFKKVVWSMQNKLLMLDVKFDHTYSYRLFELQYSTALPPVWFLDTVVTVLENNQGYRRIFLIKEEPEEVPLPLNIYPLGLMVWQEEYLAVPFINTRSVEYGIILWDGKQSIEESSFVLEVMKDSALPQSLILPVSVFITDEKKSKLVLPSLNEGNRVYSIEGKGLFSPLSLSYEIDPAGLLGTENGFLAYARNKRVLLYDFLMNSDKEIFSLEEMNLEDRLKGVSFYNNLLTFVDDKGNVVEVYLEER